MSKILILIEKRGEDVVRMQSRGERPILMTNMGHKMKNRVEPKHKLIFITKILLPGTQLRT